MKRSAGPAATTRRAMIAALASGAALATFRSTPAAADAQSSVATDVDFLNFILNLEYLKAEFYGYAAFGKGFDDSEVSVSGSGTSGATVGGSLVPLRGKLLTKTARQLAQDEVAHVALLRGILGRDAVAKPLIDLGGIGIGFRDLKEYLHVARMLEDVTVSAYASIVPLVQSKETLATATRFLVAEAQHAGNVRLLFGLKGVTATSLDAKDVIPPPAGHNVFSLDGSALAMTRTPAEVTAILKPFFPRGLNGTLR